MIEPSSLFPIDRVSSNMRLSQFLTSIVSFVSADPIHWTGDCDVDNQTAPMICGTLDVPLDYSDSQSQTLTLDVAKIVATNRPSTGGQDSIIVNFGGPGEDSLTSMASLGSQLQAYSLHFLSQTPEAKLSSRFLGLLGAKLMWSLSTPGKFFSSPPPPFSLPLIQGDRGVGKTLPFICTSNPQEQAALSTLSSTHGTASKDALAQIWNGSALLANACYQRNQPTGELIGTAYTARDLLAVSEALGQNQLNYWGIDRSVHSSMSEADFRSRHVVWDRPGFRRGIHVPRSRGAGDSGWRPEPS